MLYSDLAEVGISRLDFFRGLSYFVSVLGTVLLLISCTYFLRKTRAATVP